MNVGLAIGGLGIVAFLVWMLAALIKELLGPAVRRIREHIAAIRPVHRKNDLVVTPIDAHRERHSKKRGEGIAMLVVLCASASLQSRAQQETSTQDPSKADQAMPQAITWQYGGFIDVGGLHDFNDPANHLFRSRGTTFHVNEFNLNMAALYLRKAPSEDSRWGIEGTFQTGDDSLFFGFSAVAPNLDGSSVLRHLGPTDVSYLAPVGKGLTLQGGIFSSFIGYDSLYAKDNFNYTRPWGADFTPYLMMGVNAQYTFTPKLNAALFVINDYFHLAHPNNVPSTGGQIAYKTNDHLSLKQTVLYGPHQSETSLEFWRFLSDSIAEWKRGSATVAFEYQIGHEKLESVGTPHALWMSSQLPVHYAFSKHWIGTVRPEVAWDRDGRWTGFSQTVKAVTSTIEYRHTYRAASAIIRVEHRWDDSRGPQGGFFHDGYIVPGTPALTPSQHLLGVGVILTFDSSLQRRDQQL